MKNYSHFFQTIYDESEPAGSLGRGTHYSILRAVVFTENKESFFHDFAVIWDEDHDERVIFLIEHLYYKNLLHHFTIIGERKGSVSLINSRIDTISQNIELAQKETEEVTVDGDWWSVNIDTIKEPVCIINDSKDKVQVYLKNIDNLWSLGRKEIAENVIKPA
ncbi:hypothetical protein [Cysteiniphilum marinum]|uniref:hypothetical protein n=1 Tax=Cysteiniphilum marinum TaxID=2774191 RepID=UPI001939DA49|nr:hypothetical protein [Cysteiniphilum marinum]